MESIPKPVDIQKLALVNGLILGLINTVVIILVFYLTPNLMGAIPFIIIQFLVGVGLILYFCVDIRKKVGGYWSFKEALTGIFYMLLTSALMVFFFTLIFGKLIEPSYPVKMKEIAITKSTEMMQKWKFNQHKIDEAEADIDARIEKQFDPSLTDLFKNICTIAIMYFIFALVLAAIFKKQPPVSIYEIEE